VATSRQLVRLAQKVLRGAKAPRADLLSQAELSDIRAASDDLAECLRGYTKTLQRGYHKQAEVYADGVRSTFLRLKKFKDLNEAFQKRLSSARQKTPATLRDVLQDVAALQRAYQDVQFELHETVKVSAVMGPFTLGGVDLGRFRVTWYPDSEIVRATALEPNPAKIDQRITHPHVKAEQICFGDSATAVQAAMKCRRVMDVFDLTHGILSNYSSRNPFRDLSIWHLGQTAACYGCRTTTDQRCPVCSHASCENCRRSCNQPGCSYRGCSQCTPVCRGCAGKNKYHCGGHVYHEHTKAEVPPAPPPAPTPPVQPATQVTREQYQQNASVILPWAERVVSSRRPDFRREVEETLTTWGVITHATLDALVEYYGVREPAAPTPEPPLPIQEFDYRMLSRIEFNSLRNEVLSLVAVESREEVERHVDHVTEVWGYIYWVNLAVKLTQHPANRPTSVFFPNVPEQHRQLFQYLGSRCNVAVSFTNPFATEEPSEGLTEFPFQTPDRVLECLATFVHPDHRRSALQALGAVSAPASAQAVADALDQFELNPHLSEIDNFDVPREYWSLVDDVHSILYQRELDREEAEVSVEGAVDLDSNPFNAPPDLPQGVTTTSFETLQRFADGGVAGGIPVPADVAAGVPEVVQQLQEAGVITGAPVAVPREPTPLTREDLQDHPSLFDELAILVSAVDRWQAALRLSEALSINHTLHSREAAAVLLGLTQRQGDPEVYMVAPPRQYQWFFADVALRMRRTLYFRHEGEWYPAATQDQTSLRETAQSGGSGSGVTVE